MSDKHTSGPWTAIWNPETEHWILIGAARDVVAPRCEGNHGVWLEVADTGVRFTASTPKLLAENRLLRAKVALLEHEADSFLCGRGSHFCRECEKLRAAVDGKDANGKDVKDG